MIIVIDASYIFITPRTWSVTDINELMSAGAGSAAKLCARGRGLRGAGERDALGDEPGRPAPSLAPAGLLLVGTASRSQGVSLSLPVQPQSLLGTLPPLPPPLPLCRISGCLGSPPPSVFAVTPNLIYTQISSYLQNIKKKKAKPLPTKRLLSIPEMGYILHCTHACIYLNKFDSV